MFCPWIEMKYERSNKVWKHPKKHHSDPENQGSLAPTASKQALYPFFFLYTAFPSEPGRRMHAWLTWLPVSVSVQSVAASQLCIEFYTAPASSSSTETPPAMYLGSELGRARAHATSCAICSDARSCSAARLPVLSSLSFCDLPASTRKKVNLGILWSYQTEILMAGWTFLCQVLQVHLMSVLSSRLQNLFAMQFELMVNPVDAERQRKLTVVNTRAQWQ